VREDLTGDVVLGGLAAAYADLQPSQPETTACRNPCDKYLGQLVTDTVARTGNGAAQRPALVTVIVACRSGPSRGHEDVGGCDDGFPAARHVGRQVA
jgi:hypothetical protein